MNRLELAQALITVADYGSVQKAAIQLHQTDAAISRKITKLETYLGAKLIDRQRTGAVLTALGQHYYHECKKAIAQFNQAEALVKSSVKEPSGPLTVVTNEFYANQFIIPKLKRFLETYPKIKLTLDIAEVLPDFKKKKMDIIFGVSLKGADSLVRKHIDQLRYVLCASPSYLKKYGKPESPSELLQHHFIAHASRENPANIVLNKDQLIVIKPTVLINHSSTIVAAALNGLGVIWIPDSFVSTFIKKKKLVEVLANYNEERSDVYLYYQYQKPSNNRVNAFVDFFSNVLFD